MSLLTIAVDTMGGDLGPSAVVEGAFRAAKEFAEVKLLLVGHEEMLAQEMKKQGAHKNISILHAPTVITPSEVPTTAIREKKDSSIVVGLRAVKEGTASAFVSAGSTGALLTGATVIIGRKQGIERPALGTLLPTAKGFVLLLDSGANMDCKPSYLAQFGQMGAEYMEKVMGIKNPRVGLINVGAEEEKGNAAAKEAFPLLAASGVNFAGNIEGREVPMGAVDVAVCDGFTGNIVLKYTEGFAKTMLGMIKEELLASTITKIGAALAKPAFARLKKRFDYREVGGAPFLGLKSLVVKAHGSSDALAFKNAIRQCVIFSD
ncbi:MAG: phosphate acyltransferase PlsX [Defluviitaleaceae bacterium]|nr:phosphate acyltransferase PlsX [Defluviitaleaceae bacterium]MCL2276137.1 phosphate acyltransferase PlsX [Defluviitaleaceae bacterium]